MMRKISALIIAILIPLFSWGQAQINTKKAKIGDFTQKITKVVLTGNGLTDSSLKEEISARWRISPYEFCTVEEFENLKGNNEYYFLLCVSGQFKKDLEPSMQFLTLVKGGEGADKGLGGLLEVISIPIASAKNPSGREIIFMPAFLDIIQEYTLLSMEKDFNAYIGLANATSKITNTSHLNIVFSEDDINEAIPQHEIDMFFESELTLMGEDETDALMHENAENTLVSYVVAPADARIGSFCYKMLIDTHNHTLYYFKKHKITKNVGVGFLSDDLKRIYGGHTR